MNERSLSHFYAFAWEITARGLEAHSRVLNVSTLDASHDVETRLDLGAERKIQRIVRVRMAGDEPLVLETAYFPLELVEGLDAPILGRASIYDEIERRHGLRITRAHEAIRPTVLSRRIAALSGAPVQRHSASSAQLGGNHRVEWQNSLVRGDRFLFSRPRTSPHDRAGLIGDDCTVLQLTARNPRSPLQTRGFRSVARGRAGARVPP